MNKGIFRTTAASSLLSAVTICLGLSFIQIGCQSHKIKPDQNADFQTFLDSSFDEYVSRHPEMQTYLGLKTNYNELNDQSEESSMREHEMKKLKLKELHRYSRSSLNAVNQLNYDLYEKALTEAIEDYQFRYHDYPINQMFGDHSELPSFMINYHSISNADEAKAYVERVKQFERVMNQISEKLKIRAQKGIVLPKHLFALVYNDISHLTQGYPLTTLGESKGKKNPLLEDFEKKLKAAKIDAKISKQLVAELKTTLKSSYLNGYRLLEKTLKELEPKAPTHIAASQLPNGKAYYQTRLNRMTTTSLTPEEIHDLGLKEVARIHNEMKEVLNKLNYKKDLRAFFLELKTSPRFFYQQTAAGKKAYVKDTEAIIASIRKRLPELFTVFPKADVIVKPVEAFREKSAGTAFYSGPSEDGKRPGIYYINLSDLKQVPKYEMEALAYHEALPGHHMQVAMAIEMKNLPKFRRHAHYTAYGEGWGLYSESIPKEIGFYQDPYSDFGRLSMDLLRATRLVTDSGIHAKGWSRAQAIQYLDDETPFVRSENERAIDRYIVMPGQATAYSVGKLKIQALRAKAEKTLGNAFDIRRFHDEILKYGSLPLDVLEQKVEQWVLNETQNLSKKL